MLGIVVIGDMLVSVRGTDEAAVVLMIVSDDRYVVPLVVVVSRSMALRCQNCESLRAVEFSEPEKNTPASNVI